MFYLGCKHTMDLIQNSPLYSQIFLYDDLDSCNKTIYSFSYSLLSLSRIELWNKK